MRALPRKFDYILFFTILILVLLGILILASASAAFSQAKYGTPAFFLMRHLLVGVAPGIILGFLAYKIPLSFFKKKALIFLLFTLFAMILVFIPGIGISAGGAKRWINLGLIAVQPSEFLKLSFIIYLAAWLSARFNAGPNASQKSARFKDRHFLQSLAPFLAIISSLGLLLVLQPDLSTFGIIFFISLAMYFSAGLPIYHLLWLFFLGAGGIAALIKIAPYRMNRLLVFLRPEMDPMGMGYQVKQALIAVGSGGIFGLGLGLSVQKFGFLPEPLSDSIFAIFSEEAGFIGGIILISLFLVFIWRGIGVAKKSEDKFTELTALGIVSWLALQAFMNMGSMSGLLPLMGIPLPFIGYGGSALVSELIGAGILLNISKKALTRV